MPNISEPYLMPGGTFSGRSIFSPIHSGSLYSVDFFIHLPLVGFYSIFTLFLQLISVVLAKIGSIPGC